MSESSVVLQPRDRQILDLLRDQGFATFEQIKRAHFANKSQPACSRRLILLAERGYLKTTTLKGYFSGVGTFFPYLLALGLKGNSKIYFLSSNYRKLVANTNRLLKPDMCLHQLMLTDVKLFLEAQIPDARFLLSDPQVQLLSEFQSGRRKEFTPDISVENQRYIIAVELERTQKSRTRYLEKFAFYRDSVYSHVLYFYVNESHLNLLLKQAGSSRKFGFAHYLRSNQILSKAWGYMSLLEWMEKVQSIRTNRRADSPSLAEI